MDHNFKPGDRVVRIDVGPGPTGTVMNIRREVVRSSLKPDTSEPTGVAITVLWDNGTISHFVPEGLQRIGEISRPSAGETVSIGS